MPYCCKPEDHVKFTQRIFKELFSKIQNDVEEKENDSVTNIKLFLGQQYEDLVLKKELNLNKSYVMVINDD